MLYTRKQISETVRNVIVDALGVEDDDVVPNASLISDLGAESIDFLDITYRLEKAFTVDPNEPFKILSGELFSQIWTQVPDPQYVAGGIINKDGMRLIKQYHPRVEGLESEMSYHDAREKILTVGYVEEYIQSRFNA